MSEDYGDRISAQRIIQWGNPRCAVGAREGGTGIVSATWSLLTMHERDPRRDLRDVLRAWSCTMNSLKKLQHISPLLGSAKRLWPGLVNFVPAVAYHFYLSTRARGRLEKLA